MCICVKVMELKVCFFFFFVFFGGGLSLPLLNVDNRFSKFDVKNCSSHVSLIFSSYFFIYFSSLFFGQFF
jgi:hypothetical protein